MDVPSKRYLQFYEILGPNPLDSRGAYPLALPAGLQRSRFSADVDVVSLSESPSKSLRFQAKRWLETSPPGSSSRVRYPGGPKVTVIDSGHLPAGHSLDSVLLVRRDFSCDSGCTLLHPIYVEGDCELGKGSRTKAVFAGGRLVLAPGVEVRSWAESGGFMEIRPGCRVGDVALSRTGIQFGLGCEVGRLSAPETRTQAAVSHYETRSVDPGPVLELPAPGNDSRLPRRPIPGLDRDLLEAIGADTWFYDGDLHLAERLLLNAHLVTRGHFACPPESLLEGDVRAGSALHIGQRSLVRGRLTSDWDMVVEAGAIFQENLNSRQRIRLCTGVRGFRSDGPVSVASGGNLVIEDRVVVRGSISSGDRVRADVPERLESADWSLASGW